MSDDVTQNSTVDYRQKITWADIPVLCCFVLLFLTVALQFFTRYVLNDSLGWTEEIARYLLIAVGFSGGIVCARFNTHIYLEFFHHYLPPSVLKPTLLFCHSTTAAFFAYCGVLTIELIQRTNSNMASIAVSKDVIYYFVCACCFAMAFYTVRTVWVLWHKTAEQIALELKQSKTVGL